MLSALDEYKEWLEPDGRGGFASGTIGGVRTRRYHALVLTATTPPTGRIVLLSGLDVRVTTQTGEYVLWNHRYTPDYSTKSSRVQIESFIHEPWPRWTFQLDDGTRIQQELFVRHGSGECVVAWRVLDGRRGIKIDARPLLSGRDYHSLHHENAGFNFEARPHEDRVRFEMYAGVPGVTIHHNGRYRHEPVWYRNFEYLAERERGLDCVEDLASPGAIGFELSEGEACVILEATPSAAAAGDRDAGLMATERLARLRLDEHARRQALGSAIARAADAYIVEGTSGTTIIAGYPWFTDWGRDTFIALRGLCLATGRLDDARSILIRWAGTISQGMLPNRFPDAGGSPGTGGDPEYNSVDASLWYVIAAKELLDRTREARHTISREDRLTLIDAIKKIVSGYAAGTRFGIRMDTDGLLAAGVPGVQLTWMDARVGERVITPRIGKPVEIQALWINALAAVAEHDASWQAAHDRALASFRQKLWNEQDQCLFDVVDVDHQPGRCDASMRPNQIFAVGGLPEVLLEPEQARRVVDAVEARLLTPLGLRSLAPGDPAYAARYVGGPEQRDAIYHQGTVWPWLIGPFVEAWVRVRAGDARAITDARCRFLRPLLEHLHDAGLGHVSEIADAESPHFPRGCPFQAWSLGELLRLDRVVISKQAGGQTSMSASSRITSLQRSLPVARPTVGV